MSTALYAVALYSRDGTVLRLVSVPTKALLIVRRAKWVINQSQEVFGIDNGELPAFKRITS